MELKEGRSQNIGVNSVSARQPAARLNASQLCEHALTEHDSLGEIQSWGEQGPIWVTSC
jgi:hypothetical protein